MQQVAWTLGPRGPKKMAGCPFEVQVSPQKFEWRGALNQMASPLFRVSAFPQKMRAPKGYGLKWPVRATGLKHSARRGDGRAASHHTAKSRYAIQAFPQMREGRAVRNEMAIYSYRIKDSRPKKRWSGGSNEMASSRYAVQPFPLWKKGPRANTWNGQQPLYGFGVSPYRAGKQGVPK